MRVGRSLRRGGVVLAVALLTSVLSACNPDRVYTYRIATRGPVTADVGHFGRHVASTLSDPRGWSLGGAISFRQTTGAADFTIWLSTAAQLPSFSSRCSSQWSCRVGPNVVINQDRWLHGSPHWPYGVDTYQHYVVNHEVGHWLGLGHRSCRGGAGVRAPVMVQQSKGGAALGACRFNVWPTPDELGAVASARGIGVRPSGIPSPDDPFGRIDHTRVTRDGAGKPRRVQLIGWAIDGDTTRPLAVSVHVDGRPATIASAGLRRTDVAKTYPRYGTARGYDVTVDVPPSARVVCVDAHGVGSGNWTASLGCRVVK
jgi:hypothetical protein